MSCNSARSLVTKTRILLNGQIQVSGTVVFVLCGSAAANEAPVHHFDNGGLGVAGHLCDLVIAHFFPGIKTKRLIESAEMEYPKLMYEMYTESETSYGDITRYFTKNEIQVYEKTLKRGFFLQLLRNPVYIQADMDIYEHFKAQGAKMESLPELFTCDYSCSAWNVRSRYF